MIYSVLLWVKQNYQYKNYKKEKEKSRSMDSTVEFKHQTR